MSRADRSLLGQALETVLSAPIQLKILGIGLLVSLLFGSVTLFVVRAHVGETSEEALEEQTVALADSLASRVERPLVTGDKTRVQDILNEVGIEWEHLAWILAVDRKGGAFGRRAPRAVVPAATVELASSPGERTSGWVVDGGTQHRVFSATSPVLGGQLGQLIVAQYGYPVDQRVAAATRTVLAALAACTLLGLSLALVLTNLLVLPMRDLVQTADAVGSGDLDQRALLYHDDEIGTLARRFNDMVDNLRAQRDALLREQATHKQLVDKVLTSEEDERARIARELHDELGQALTALRMMVRGSKEHGEHCIRHRTELDDAIGGAIEQVRQMAWRLRPSILDDYGLESALRRHVEEVAPLTSCELDMEFVSETGLPDRLDPSIEVALYRIAQEALTNVIRHAGARHASVMLYRTQGEVRLLVEDDGIGFDATALPRSGEDAGLGLAGMVERASMIGGEIAFESGPGGGTSIRVNVPLEG